MFDPAAQDICRSLVEGTDDLLTLLGGDGRILYDNPVVESLLGYRQGELVGRSAFELIHPGDYSAAVTLLAEMTAGGRSRASLTLRFRGRDGQWRVLESSGRVVGAAGGGAQVVVTSRAAPARSEGEEGGGGAEIEAARLDVVERLARAAEFRDDDTGRHLRRVGEVAAQLAERSGLPEEIATILRRTAPLHDVGKIGIPDAILHKPGPLLPEEQEVMRTHPILGARILCGGGGGLIRAAEEIALSHHERWDGLGYPRGLRGRSIPVLARIVSIADVFDALTHARPYRPAWEPERALALIRAESGRMFDPELVEAFE